MIGVCCLQWRTAKKWTINKQIINKLETTPRATERAMTGITLTSKWKTNASDGEHHKTRGYCKMRFCRFYTFSYLTTNIHYIQLNAKFDRFNSLWSDTRYGIKEVAKLEFILDIDIGKRISSSIPIVTITER